MKDSTPACSYSTSPEKVPKDEDPTVDCPHSTDERCDQSAKSNNIRLPDVLATSLGDQSKRACADEAGEKECLWVRRR